MFKKAYEENPVYALKCLFYIKLEHRYTRYIGIGIIIIVNYFL
jgi:hypothetical protein